MLTRAGVWTKAVRNYWWLSTAVGLYFAAAFWAWGGSKAAILSGALFFFFAFLGLLAHYRVHFHERLPQVALIVGHLLVGQFILVWQKSHLPLIDYTATGNPATRDFLVYLVSVLIVGVMSMFGGLVAGGLGLAVHYVFIFNAHEEFSFKWIFPVFMVLAGDILFTASSRLDEAYEQLEELANRDKLTGLLNRNRLASEFDRLKTLAAETQQSLLLVAWDLDGLKQINDQQGHAAGDALIHKFATTLKVNVRKTTDARLGDAAFRVGGDEFISMHLKIDAGEHLLARVRKAFPSVSAGWILCNSLNLDQALTQADQALYDDKLRRKKEFST
jgi:diguanylate cyclase (GGDEF)-like protein